MIYRQGDILFVKANVSNEGKPVTREGGRIIVARGESTGHAHAIVTPTAMMLRSEVLEREWVVAPDGAEVVHEEHDTLTLPPGAYWVVRQREYTPEAIRTVQD